jgi:hypothetical protein
MANPFGVENSLISQRAGPATVSGVRPEGEAGEQM